MIFLYGGSVIVNEARRSLQDWVKTHIGEIDTAYSQYQHHLSTTDTKKESNTALFVRSWDLSHSGTNALSSIYFSVP